MYLPWNGFPYVKYYEDKVFNVVVEANLEWEKWVNLDWLGWIVKEKSLQTLLWLLPAVMFCFCWDYETRGCHWFQH